MIHSSAKRSLRTTARPRAAKFKEGIGKLSTAVAPFFGLPYEGSRDVWQLAANYFRETPSSDITRRVRHQIKELVDEPDLHDDRNRIWNALRTNDSTAFADAVLAAQQKNSEAVDAGWLSRIVAGKYADLEYVDRQIAEGAFNENQLTDEQHDALNDMRLDRESMLRLMSEFVDRNF